MSVPLKEETIRELDACEAALQRCQDVLLGDELRRELHGEGKMPPLETATRYMSLASVVTALIGVYHKTRGIDPVGTKVGKEMNRLESYRKKLNKIQARDELKKSKKTVELDIAAASRFIAAAQPQLTVEQKKDMIQRGAKAADEKKRMRKDGGEQKSKKKKHEGTSAQAAGTSAQAAGTSAQAAGTSAQAAGTSAQAAGTSAQAAGTSAKAAGTSAKAAGLNTSSRDAALEFLSTIMNETGGVGN